MNPVVEDADVPGLAVQGLNEATRKARQAGEIVVVRDGQLVKCVEGVRFEVLRAVPERKRVTSRTKRLK